jgi:hypothetical protein
LRSAILHMATMGNTPESLLESSGLTKLQREFDDDVGGRDNPRLSRVAWPDISELPNNGVLVCYLCIGSN